MEWFTSVEEVVCRTEDVIRRRLDTVRGKSDDGSHVATVSTPTLDRQGDTVNQRGGQWGNFLKTGAVFFGHNTKALPVAKCTGIDVRDHATVATFHFLKDDEFAARVQNAWEQGVLACSIGFRPIDSSQTIQGVSFDTWEALEFSLVGVPANPEAQQIVRSLNRDSVNRTMTHPNTPSGDDSVIEISEVQTFEELKAYVTETVDTRAVEVEQANGMIRAELARITRELVRKAVRDRLEAHTGRKLRGHGFPDIEGRR